MAKQSVVTNFWFNNQAEDAANFYVGLIPNSRIVHVSRYPEGSPVPAGQALVVSFELGGVSYLALNGGPHYQLTPAVSLVVSCETQQEIDDYWEKLLADGGTPSRCGWLTDRFGLSWQVVPKDLPSLLMNTDKKKAAAAMKAMMGMTKFDIAALQKAAADA